MCYEIGTSLHATAVSEGQASKTFAAFLSPVICVMSSQIHHEFQRLYIMLVLSARCGSICIQIWCNRHLVSLS